MRPTEENPRLAARIEEAKTELASVEAELGPLESGLNDPPRCLLAVLSANFITRVVKVRLGLGDDDLAALERLIANVMCRRDEHDQELATDPRRNAVYLALHNVDLGDRDREALGEALRAALWRPLASEVPR